MRQWYDSNYIEYLLYSVTYVSCFLFCDLNSAEPCHCIVQSYIEISRIISEGETYSNVCHEQEKDTCRENVSLISQVKKRKNMYWCN